MTVHDLERLRRHRARDGIAQSTHELVELDGDRRAVTRGDVPIAMERTRQLGVLLGGVRILIAGVRIGRRAWAIGRRRANAAADCDS